MTDRTILLSVRPKYAHLILDGSKTVELRRVCPNIGPGDFIMMYESSPARRVRALLHVEEIIHDAPTQLWPRVRRDAGVTRTDFDRYFAGAATAVGIRLHVADNLSPPLHLAELQRVAPGFRPPQSYQYVHRLATDLRTLLTSSWPRTLPSGSP